MNIAIALAWLAILAAGAIGWAMNVFSLIAHIADPLSTLLALRVVGVFVAPIGVILGWLA